MEKKTITLADRLVEKIKKLEATNPQGFVGDVKPECYQLIDASIDLDELTAALLRVGGNQRIHAHENVRHDVRKEKNFAVINTPQNDQTKSARGTLANNRWEAYDNLEQQLNHQLSIVFEKSSQATQDDFLVRIKTQKDDKFNKRYQLRQQLYLNEKDYEYGQWFYSHKAGEEKKFQTEQAAYYLEKGLKKSAAEQQAKYDYEYLMKEYWIADTNEFQLKRLYEHLRFISKTQAEQCAVAIETGLERNR